MCTIDFDPPEAYREEQRTARKPHRCEDCSTPITPGTRYVYISGVWDGRGDSFHRCLECAAISDAARDAGCITSIGGTLEEAPEALVSGEHDDAPEALGRLAGLLFAARERRDSFESAKFNSGGAL
jgi:hypothetical protein